MLKKVMGCICLVGLSAVPAACSMNNYDSDMKQTIEQSVPWGDVGKQQDTVSDTSGAGDGRMIYDNTALYENRDPASVVTMYLTVSEGNASDNTDHTWTQVNSYSAYHYAELGIERYAVNGLLQVGDENGPVEGQLGYGQVVPNATVTIRGQTSTRYAQKNYRITIRDNKGTWDDQKVINLNKHEQDQSRFANKLCYDLMSELPGMIAMRTRFVHLYVKDMTEGGSGEFKDYGLYTQVEQLNKRALRSHGLDKNGQLYKINFFEFYRYEDVIMVKNDADYDVDAFEDLIEIKGNDDHSKLIAMLDELNDYSIPITQIMDRWFCRENLFSWMAFHILMGNVDTQSRNVFLYSPLNSDTFYFISWDNDGAFYDTKAKLRSQDRGWEIGISNYWGNVLFRRVLMDNELRAGLDEKIEEYRNIITREKLDFIYRLKTGALIESSMMIGAILAGASSDEVSRVEQIAAKLGLAFQIQDDVLDVTSTLEVLGKPVGSDEKNNKATYVTFEGLDKAVSDVERISKEAEEQLDDLGYDDAFLNELFEYLIHREK